MVEWVGHGRESSIGGAASRTPGGCGRSHATARGARWSTAADASIAVMRALILADGDAPTRARLDAAWPGWDEGIEFVVAADGGARHARTLGVTIDQWVGDGDSIDPAELARLEASGVPLAHARADKDESDTELALRLAAHRAPDGVVIVGALGGARFDHAVANLGLPVIGAASGTPVILLSETARVGWLLAPAPDGGPETWALVGRPGDLVSLLPLGVGVEGVTTHDLVYPLADEPLPAGTTRGLSNVIAAPGASLELRSGALLIIEVPATLDR
jgi:thiamine pyrophosphokinase